MVLKFNRLFTLIAAAVLAMPFALTASGASAGNLEIGAFASYPDGAEGTVPYGFTATYVMPGHSDDDVCFTCVMPVFEVSKASIDKGGPVGQGLSATAGGRWHVTETIFVQGTFGIQGVDVDGNVSEKLTYMGTAGWKINNVGLRLNYGSHHGFKDAHISTGVFFSF